MEEGDAASPSSSLLVWGTLEEVAAAATASFPQSPLGVWPSATAMAATLGSQFEDHGLSRQIDVSGSSRDQGGDRPLVRDALWMKKNELV